MFRAASIAGKTILLLLIVFMSNHGLQERFLYFVNAGRYALGIIYCTIWLAALLAVLFTAFTPQLRVRVIWGAGIVLSGLLADVYFCLMKVHFNIDAVEALWNMRFWAGDVVTSFWNLMLWPVIRARHYSV